MGKGFRHALTAMVVVTMAAPVAAQSYSDSYTFLKAVKERDGSKVTSLLAQPGTVVVNARERGSGEGGLHIVTRARDRAWLSFLLGKGARPDLQNEVGNTALAIAAELGWVDGAQLLVERRAAVDSVNSRGETPLILAVQQRNLPIVRLLLAAGADPKRTDSVAGLSAIDYARRDLRSASILKLLEAPAPAPARAVAGPKL